MGRITEREQLVRNLVRLRRAERELGASADLATVRRDLERMLGPTVPRAMAARLLGVSQPGLEHRVAAGDIPVVITPAGRREIPVATLVELLEAIEGRALGPVLDERRAAAHRLRVVPPDPPTEGHRGAEARSLLFHQAVVERLDPDQVARARERLERWRDAGSVPAPVARRWSSLLDAPLEDIAERLTADDDDGRALRQSSPFAGALTEPERRRLLDATTP